MDPNDYYYRNKDKINAKRRERRSRTHRGDKKPPIHRFFWLAKRYATRKGKEWTLTIEQYGNIFRTPCFYCKCSMEKYGPIGLDRKDSSKGYTIDNVVSCCRHCNLMKNDKFTFDEMVVAMRAVLDLRSKVL